MFSGMISSQSPGKKEAYKHPALPAQHFQQKEKEGRKLQLPLKRQGMGGHTQAKSWGWRGRPWSCDFSCLPTGGSDSVEGS